jgi:hypothetical protein
MTNDIIDELERLCFSLLGSINEVKLEEQPTKAQLDMMQSDLQKLSQFIFNLHRANNAD